MIIFLLVLKWTLLEERWMDLNLVNQTILLFLCSKAIPYKWRIVVWLSQLGIEANLSPWIEAKLCQGFIRSSLAGIDHIIKGANPIMMCLITLSCRLCSALSKRFGRLKIESTLHPLCVSTSTVGNYHIQRPHKEESDLCMNLLGQNMYMFVDRPLHHSYQKPFPIPIMSEKNGIFERSYHLFWMVKW